MLVHIVQSLHAIARRGVARSTRSLFPGPGARFGSSTTPAASAAAAATAAHNATAAAAAAPALSQGDDNLHHRFASLRPAPLRPPANTSRQQDESKHKMAGSKANSRPGNRPVPFYDFKRFERKFLYGKPMRFPTEMDICPFFRPEADDPEDEVRENQLSQPRVPISELGSLLSPEFDIGPDAGQGERTKHADSLFLAFADHPVTGKSERYLLKFFPASGKFQRNARREVLFSYLMVEAGLATNAPKIGLLKFNGLECVVRRFYDGRDGRFLLQSASNLPGVSNSMLVANYAIRYVLFGDLDMNNPGNIIFTRHSGFSGDTILNIDGEEIMPDEESMRFLGDTQWQPGDPIPGSFQWRRKRAAELGDQAFFERQLESENGLLAMLRVRHERDMVALGKLRLSSEVAVRAIESRQYFEQLARTFCAVPVEKLRKGTADFQVTLDKWQRHLENNPAVSINLFHLCTGAYLD